MVESTKDFLKNSVNNSDCKIVFAFGRGGSGKSTILNALGGNFETGDSASSVTQDFCAWPSDILRL